MADDSDDFFRAGVQFAEAGLTAGENGALGEGVGVGGEVGGFVGERRVDGGEVVLGEFGGDGGEGGAGVAGFVGIFLPESGGSDWRMWLVVVMDYHVEDGRISVVQVKLIRIEECYLMLRKTYLEYPF